MKEFARTSQSMVSGTAALKEAPPSATGLNIVPVSFGASAHSAPTSPEPRTTRESSGSGSFRLPLLDSISLEQLEGKPFGTITFMDAFWAGLLYSAIAVAALFIAA